MSTKKAIISLEDNDPRISIIVQIEDLDHPYAMVTYDYGTKKTTYEIRLKPTEAIQAETLEDQRIKLNKHIERPDVVIGSDLLEIAALVLRQKQRSRESKVQAEIDEFVYM